MKRRDFCRSAMTTAATLAMPAGFIFTSGARAGDMPSVPAITLSGQETILAGSAVNEFRESLGGQLLLNGDEGYDHARAVWNAMINRHPALIARCEGAADVINAVNFAHAD